MVQGEKMEKKRIRIRRKGGLPVLALFLTGFLAGVVLPNLAFKLGWKQQAFASAYLLGTFGKQSVSGMEYLLEILQMRGGYFLLCILCGFTVFGVPLAVLGMLGAGAGIGALLSMSVLQFGLAGGAVGAGLLFPQYLVYIPVLFVVMDMVYQESMGMWRNRGIFPQKISGFALESLLCAAIYFGGMLLECYVNPWVVEKIMDRINFF